MIEFLDPTAEVVAQEPPRVPGPASLAGRRVALIDNTKTNSDRLLEKIGDILKAEHGVAETRVWRKRNPSVPIEDAALAEVKAKYDVAVAGVGD
ncbi:MAG: hypothetical protein ACE147_21930 [Candidatus Methylomirabilales bacterium]